MVKSREKNHKQCKKFRFNFGQLNQIQETTPRKNHGQTEFVRATPCNGFYLKYVNPWYPFYGSTVISNLCDLQAGSGL
jgi:hypothetical protein